MKLKRNIIPKYIGIALLILLCLIFLIPDLSLRAYVFLISPKSALTMEYVEDKEAWDLADEPKDNMTIYRIMQRKRTLTWFCGRSDVMARSTLLAVTGSADSTMKGRFCRTANQYNPFYAAWDALSLAAFSMAGAYFPCVSMEFTVH